MHKRFSNGLTNLLAIGNILGLYNFLLKLISYNFFFLFFIILLVNLDGNGVSSSACSIIVSVFKFLEALTDIVYQRGEMVKFLRFYSSAVLPL